MGDSLNRGVYHSVIQSGEIGSLAKSQKLTWLCGKQLDPENHRCVAFIKSLANPSPLQKSLIESSLKRSLSDATSVYAFISTLDSYPTKLPTAAIISRIHAETDAYLPILLSSLLQHDKSKFDHVY